MNKDEIHFLRSFQDPVKSDALRSIRNNTAFGMEVAEAAVHWWLWTATEGYVGKQERNDGERIGYGEGNEVGHVSTEYCSIGSQPVMDGCVCGVIVSVLYGRTMETVGTLQWCQ